MPKIKAEKIIFPRNNPTLDAIDAEIERLAWVSTCSLSAGTIGNECDRAVWYLSRWVRKSKFNAKSLKTFEDGHDSEEKMAKRLSMVARVRDRQFKVEFLGGRIRGYIDGIIEGLKESSQPHVWEHKAVADTGWKKINKLLDTVADEKTILKQWNPIYYAQAQLYMYGTLLRRHFLTVTTQGGREYVSVRTALDKDYCENLLARASEIIQLDAAPSVIGKDKKSWPCLMCDFKNYCYPETVEDILENPPQKHCRTCCHVSVVKKEDTFESVCGLGMLNKDNPGMERSGCSEHVFNYTLISHEQVELDGRNMVFKIGGGQIRAKDDKWVVA